MSTNQFYVNVSNEDVSPIVDLNNAPNSSCELIIQNLNGEGIVAYLGNSKMYDSEIWGLRLLDGMSISIALGSTDELYAIADGNITLNVLKTSGPRR
jgi:hypothetical protein